MNESSNEDAKDLRDLPSELILYIARHTDSTGLFGLLLGCQHTSRSLLRSHTFGEILYTKVRATFPQVDEGKGYTPYQWFISLEMSRLIRRKCEQKLAARIETFHLKLKRKVYYRTLVSLMCEDSPDQLTTFCGVYHLLRDTAWCRPVELCCVTRVNGWNLKRFHRPIHNEVCVKNEECLKINFWS